MVQRLAIAAFMLVFAGCSTSTLESEVAGTVTLDGATLGPGVVTFSPIGDGNPATGTVERNGSYSLTTNHASGLAAGKYRVAVSIREMPMNVKTGDRPPPGKLLHPEKYRQSATSGLEFEVVPGSNTIDLELRSQ